MPHQLTKGEKISAMAEKIYTEAVGNRMGLDDYHVRYDVEFKEFCSATALVAVEAARTFYELTDSS